MIKNTIADNIIVQPTIEQPKHNEWRDNLAKKLIKNIND